MLHTSVEPRALGRLQSAHQAPAHNQNIGNHSKSVDFSSHPKTQRLWLRAVPRQEVVHVAACGCGRGSSSESSLAKAAGDNHLVLPQRES